MKGREDALPAFRPPRTTLKLLNLRKLTALGEHRFLPLSPWQFLWRPEAMRPKGDCLEDEVRIAGGSHERGVDGVAIMAKKEAAVRPAAGIHATDGGLDCKSTSLC